MREILFRGFSMDSGELVEGFLVQTKSHTYIIQHGWYNDDLFISLYNIIDKVDPATVGQFTGLTDKNGKKIFEGDVIRFHKFRYEPDWTGVISYENCHYIASGRMPLAYEKRKGEEAFFCPFEVAVSGIDKETIEVIGNIYDNPEFLEGGIDNG